MGSSLLQTLEEKGFPRKWRRKLSLEDTILGSYLLGGRELPAMMMSPTLGEFLSSHTNAPLPCRHFTAAYRGFPPCTQAQPHINRETGYNNVLLPHAPPQELLPTALRSKTMSPFSPPPLSIPRIMFSLPRIMSPALCPTDAVSSYRDCKSIWPLITSALLAVLYIICTFFNSATNLKNAVHFSMFKCLV